MDDAALDAARKHWALGSSPITLVAARENRVYRVGMPKGPTALRLHRPGYRRHEEIHAELQWMAMLAENGINVPRPIAGADGATLLTINDTAISMLSWVDASPLSQQTASSALYFELGRVLARMHALADAWQPPTNFSRPSWDLVGDQPTWGRFWENPLLSAEQRHRFMIFREHARLAMGKLEAADYGLIHADLVPDNVLSDGQQLWLIDFDDGGYGHRLFDLATVTHRSRRRTGSDAYAKAMLEGYGTSRAIDHESLPLFEAMRACSYVGWNMTRMDEAGGRERHIRFVSEAEAAIDACLRA